MLAVVTPYHTESLDVLARARRSVEAQTVPCRHVMVADGHPRAEVEAWAVEHIVLPSEHRDGGSFARGVGALHAVSTGAEAVAFLDADNWYEPDHLASLAAKAAESRAAVCTSARILRRPDGSVLAELDPESDGRFFADTSTLLVVREAVDILAVWLTTPARVGVFGDQIVWATIREKGYPTAHTGRATLNYSTRYAAHYVTRGEDPPADAVDMGNLEDAIRYWQALPTATRRRMMGLPPLALAAAPTPRQERGGGT